jgi:hypothetical protein
LKTFVDVFHSKFNQRTNKHMMILGGSAAISGSKNKLKNGEKEE